MSVESYKIDTVADRALHILVGEAGPDENLDREVRWALQAAQLELVNEVNPHSFRHSFTITTVEDQAEYDLPDDFKAIIEDTVRRTEDSILLREMPEQIYNRARLLVGDSSGTPEQYYIARKDKGNGAWVIFLSPTPDTDGDTIDGTYRSLPAPVWNSTRGEDTPLDLRFPPEFVPLLVHGIIACGHFSRYLNTTDLAIHTKKWADGIAAFKKNNNPVVGKAYSRSPYPPKTMRVPWGGGVHPAWWGPDITAAP